MYDQVTLAGVFQVLDMDVVKIGNIHLMAVTTGFSENSGSPKVRRCFQNFLNENAKITSNLLFIDIESFLF